MAGNREAGLRAAATMKERYGESYYQDIAVKSQAAWVANGRKPRGFATMSPEMRSACGVKGGQRSRRGKKNAA